MDGPQILNDDDVAGIVRLTARQVRKLARQGDLPHIVLPTGDVRFIRDDINKWIEAQRHPRGEDAGK